MKNLKDFVLNEYNYDLKLRFLLDEFSIEEIAAFIVDCVTGDDENYRDILTFARDLYIGSDLTESESEQYYNELKEKGFFTLLNAKLYSPFAGYTIYTIGKFSDPDNAPYLEDAYEANYSRSNPLLAYRCLSEMDWLGSAKVSGYLDELHKENSIVSKIALLYYYQPRTYLEKEFDALMEDKRLFEFIVPDSDEVSSEDIYMRLWSLERYLDEYFGYYTASEMSHDVFLTLASKFFAEFDKTQNQRDDPNSQLQSRQLSGPNPEEQQ